MPPSRLATPVMKYEAQADKQGLGKGNCDDNEDDPEELPVERVGCAVVLGGVDDRHNSCKMRGRYWILLWRSGVGLCGCWRVK